MDIGRCFYAGKQRTQVSTFVESSPVLRQMHVLLNFRDYSVFMLACSSFSFILRFIGAYFLLQDSERMRFMLWCDSSAVCF